MTAKKKSFRADLNPALQFITAPDEEPEAVEVQAPAKPPEGYKINPMYIETKSKRLQILLTPSLYNTIKLRAIAEGRSVNDLVNYILEEATKGE